MRWPKYWSVSLSIIPSKEHPELISFRMDRLDVLAVQGTLRSLLQQDWTRSVFISIPKKGNAKECSNYHTIALVSHASKVMFKILQARFQQYVNRELPDVQPGFRKDRGSRDQIARIHWIIEKASVRMRVVQLCPTLCHPKDYTVHGILQARILEWVAFPFSNGSSQTRD